MKMGTVPRGQWVGVSGWVSGWGQWVGEWVGSVGQQVQCSVLGCGSG